MKNFKPQKVSNSCTVKTRKPTTYIWPWLVLGSIGIITHLFMPHLNVQCVSEWGSKFI